MDLEQAVCPGLFEEMVDWMFRQHVREHRQSSR